MNVLLRMWIFTFFLHFLPITSLNCWMPLLWSANFEYMSMSELWMFGFARSSGTIIVQVLNGRTLILWSTTKSEFAVRLFNSQYQNVMSDDTLHTCIVQYHWNQYNYSAAAMKHSALYREGSTHFNKTDELFKRCYENMLWCGLQFPRVLKRFRRGLREFMLLQGYFSQLRNESWSFHVDGVTENCVPRSLTSVSLITANKLPMIEFLNFHSVLVRVEDVALRHKQLASEFYNDSIFIPDKDSYRFDFDQAPLHYVFTTATGTYEGVQVGLVVILMLVIVFSCAA